VWTGWLAPIVDGLVTDTDGAEPLETALRALSEPAPIKLMPPVQAQRERLEAHLAARRRDGHAAGVHWAEAQRLADECGMTFEAAVIALERAEHAVSTATMPVDWAAVATASSAFERLAAAPWLMRAQALSQPHGA
jgi:hypothetical protein